jgi:hypothetical protein
VTHIGKELIDMVMKYVYDNRIGNLTAEAVGVVKGEKHFPVFENDMIFKPLTKSKPMSTPLFAYAEVFWSHVIDEYFMPAPRYQLAWCRGYEDVEEKYLDYGTVVPYIYNPAKGEHLMNLLEFFRKHPDNHVDIDHYVNYCQMFYDYTDIFQAKYFQEHHDIASQLAMNMLVAILKGDQNYHYENVAFICDSSDNIYGLAPMIDHEFSTYYMFPDNPHENIRWFNELQRSISGEPVKDGEYDFVTNPTERKLMERSAVALYNNLLYVREHFPDVTQDFLNKLSRFEADLKNHSDEILLQKELDYPDTANSNAWLIGKARYKDMNEALAREYEEKYRNTYKKIDFNRVNFVARSEIEMVIAQLRHHLCRTPA